MLSPYRVLDLTDARAELGPWILARLGADVIKVEPPGGAPSRHAPPLGVNDAVTPSLRFHAYNRGKRSVTLDLQSDTGRADFLRLVGSSDILIENAAPGAMAARGLGPDVLTRANPELVHVSITPFGQSGPYAGHAATDLTLAAMGGMVAVTGDADRAPVRVSAPQAWLHASAESAVAALVALERRRQMGTRQSVDLSVQTAVFWTTLNASIASWVQGRNIERQGTDVQLGTNTLKVMFPCRDGHAVFVINGAFVAKLVHWLVAEGTVPPSWLDDEDWPSYDVRMLTGQPVAHSLEEVTARLAELSICHTKQELFERGAAANVFLAPVNTVADVLALDHLDARAYWHPLTLADGRVVRAPGPFTRPSMAPALPQRGVPEPGEHTEEVLGQLRGRGIGDGGWGTTPEVDRVRSVHEAHGTSPQPPSPIPHPRLPLTGVKVADFSWVGVGPITGKYLADHGATVVRVETANPPDRLRVGGPFKDGVYGPNRSQFYGAFNTSKLSLSLDLKRPAGRETALRLAAWADVVIESFTPGTVRDLGLDYETIRARNPSVIMASTCLMGQSGPVASLAGFGTHAAAISGFSYVTGWPDRPPSGPYVAYTDTIAPRLLAATILSALDHRRRTGEGGYIEQSQMEAALHFLAPELLDYQVNGTVPTRTGNADPTCAPHGVYPCAGADQWIAIAVETDEQWRALCAGMGSPVWATRPEFETTAGRIAARDGIDGALAEWTRDQQPHALMERLQAAGVPAGAVQRSSDLLADPQLAHRRFFRPLPHPEMGDVPYEGHQFRIAGHDNGPRFAAPCLGEHSIQVMTELLGMTDEEVGEVVASGTVV